MVGAMSETNRKELTELCAIVTEELETWSELSKSEQVLFWRHFFELRDLCHQIDREFPLYNADGSKA